MTRQRVTVAAMLVLALPIALPAQEPGPRPSHAVMERLVSRARAQLLDDVRQGRFDSIPALMDANVSAVVGADSLRGRDAVAAAISGRFKNVGRATLYFSPETYEDCTDGLYEHGGEYTLNLENRTVGADTLLGRYAVRWIVRDSTALVLALAIARVAEPEPRIAGCRPVGRAMFMPRRVRVLVVGLGVGRSQALADLKNELEAQGYTTQSTAGLEVHSGGFRPGLELAAEYRAWHSLWLEAGATLVAEEGSDAGGHLTGAPSHFEATYETRLVWAVASLEWHQLRVGAGPVYAMTSWYGEERDYVPLTGVPAPTVRDSARWDADGLGVLVRAAYVFPLTDRAFVEARGDVRFVKGGPAPAVGYFQGGTFGNSAATLRLGLGFGL